MGLPPKRRSGAGAGDCLNSLSDGTHMKWISALLMLVLLVAGCSTQDTEKTKQQAEKATEKIKEESKSAAVELKKDAKEAAKQTKAAIEGVAQGLRTPDKPVNVNSASRTRLQTLPGV